MKAFGLIGNPLTHSFSKSFFEEKFKFENLENHSYSLFELRSIEEVLALKLDPFLIGLNVTIPYKQSILPYLDHISEVALAIGAVNTIKIVDGVWFGYNTDYIGFLNSLKPLLPYNIKKALVLGSGGAYCAIKYALQKLSISCSLVSRNSASKDYSYSEITSSVIKDHQLIINATPLGMFPNINTAPPFPFHLLSPNHIVYDLIYNPEESLFLKNSSFMGCQIKNGYEMLTIQAEESWKIWNDASDLHQSLKLI